VHSVLFVHVKRVGCNHLSNMMLQVGALAASEAAVLVLKGEVVQLWVCEREEEFKTKTSHTHTDTHTLTYHYRGTHSPRCVVG